MAVITIQGLTKRFRDFIAVNKVNLEINDGECVGLLGPNGAGKTTLIRMITAISPPTEGNIWIAGHNIKNSPRFIKARLGVVPQHDNLDSDLTTLENLTTFARYFDIPKKNAIERSIELLKFFELMDKANSRMVELSGGMKRRLLIARCMLNQPDIIILDEPTTGLDPHARHLVWEKLTDLKSQGITQILCTQNMEEASYLCDRVAIMDHGKILCLDRPEMLIHHHAGESVWEIGLKSEDRNNIISYLVKNNIEYRESGGKINVFYSDDAEYLRSLVNNETNLRSRPANLEDVFMKLTGRLLQEE